MKKVVQFKKEQGSKISLVPLPTCSVLAQFKYSSQITKYFCSRVTYVLFKGKNKIIVRITKQYEFFCIQNKAQLSLLRKCQRMTLLHFELQYTVQSSKFKSNDAAASNMPWASSRAFTDNQVSVA